MKNVPFKSQEHYWSTEGGKIWLENISHFESMIEPIGHNLVDVSMRHQPNCIIDIGCGGGLTTLNLAELIGNEGSVVGIDISAPLISECRLRAKKSGIMNAEFVCGDAAKFHFAANRADLIFSRFGVMFFEEPIMAFMNLSNALMDGGCIVFSCWGAMSDNPWMNELLNILGSYTNLPKPEPGTPGPFAFSNQEYITTVLASSGFRNIEINPWTGNLLIGSPGMNSLAAAQFLLRSSALVQSLKDSISDVQDEIFEKLVEKLSKYSKKDGVYMPASAWIITAVK